MRTTAILGLAPMLLCIAAAPANAPGQALAQASTNMVQAAPDAAGPARTEEAKICKQLPTSYTRLPNRACLTKQQWEQLNKQLEDDR
jgi:hypothetical protein